MPIAANGLLFLKVLDQVLFHHDKASTGNSVQLYPVFAKTVTALDTLKENGTKTQGVDASANKY